MAAVLLESDAVLLLLLIGNALLLFIGNAVLLSLVVGGAGGGGQASLTKKLTVQRVLQLSVRGHGNPGDGSVPMHDASESTKAKSNNGAQEEGEMLRVDSGDERPSVLNTLTVSVED